jgi:polysaccharide biosynthesis protein PslG
MIHILSHCRRPLGVIAFLTLPFAAQAQTAPATPARTGGWTMSPFGIGACNQTSQELEKWIPKMEEIGIRVIRTFRSNWDSVEPEEGKWNWPLVDRQMAYLAEHGFESGGLLYGGVRWNTKDKGGLPVNNLPAWSNYVSELVKHCKAKVKYWEVWNEPPNGTGKDQTPADYASLMVSTYDAAKAADPGCYVGLAAKSAHVNYLEQTIKAGAKGHYDYIILHPYEVLNGIADNVGTEAVYMHIVPTVRKMLAAQDPAKVNVPIIFTELGCDAKKGLDVQAHALVKAYAMGIAQGVACIQWFEGMDGDSGPMGLLKRDGTPRPSYTAMAQLIRHLGQHPTYLGWVLLNGKDYGFVLQGAKGTVLATWAPRGEADLVKFGQTVQIVNPLTGDAISADSYNLTVAPILVLGVPAKIVAQAQANKNKPLLWGGDYANAKSVSVTMGEKNVEKGLHTMSGNAVAEAVVAYGGSARAGSVPGGNVFVVDPTFLSYTTTPIEITAVVRRNEANDNAGFNLQYESTSGLKGGRGWYTVPDNKEWHTVSWKIDDAQFVNYWGFNFSFNSDGNKLNKYYIQSVTVTKLAR